MSYTSKDLVDADGRVVRRNYVQRAGEKLPDGCRLVTSQRTPSIGIALRDKLDELKRDSERATTPYVREYPEFEKKTWAKQEDEARAWMADNSALTPFLDELAEHRGIDRVLLIEKVYQKATFFEALSVKLVGLRQKLEDQAKSAHAAGDLAALKAVRWPPRLQDGEQEQPAEGGEDHEQPV